MFWLLNESESVAGEAQSAAHEMPPVVEFVNYWLGPWAHKFELAYTKPAWDWFFSKFGTDAEAVFGPYTPENAIPWYTVMFVLACILSLVVIWVLKGRLSED